MGKVCHKNSFALAFKQSDMGKKTSRFSIQYEHFILKIEIINAGVNSPKDNGERTAFKLSPGLLQAVQHEQFN